MQIRAMIGIAAATWMGVFARDASCAELGTVNEAKAMLERAIVELERDRLGAIEQFNHNKPQFRDRDLFVFCFDADSGRFSAHEAFVARDVRSMRDANGKSYGIEMYGSTATGGIVEVTFAAPVPGSTELAEKRAYLARVGDQVCGVSAYESGGKVLSAK